MIPKVRRFQAKIKTPRAISSFSAVRNLVVIWLVLKSSSNVAEDFLLENESIPSAMLYQALFGLSLWRSIPDVYPINIKSPISSWHWERQPPLAALRQRKGSRARAVTRACYEAGPFLIRRTLPPKQEDQQHSPSYPITSP